MLSLAALMTGCTTRKNSIQTADMKTVASYSDSKLAPAMSYHTGGHWYMMLNTLGGLHFGISVSDKPDEIIEIYDSGSSVIATFSADGNIAAWGEYDSGAGITRWKLYYADSDEIFTMYETDENYKEQCKKVIVCNNGVYYVVNNLTAGESELREYNIENGREQVILTAASPEDSSNLSVNKNGTVITFTAANEKKEPLIQTYDTDTGTVSKITVPSGIQSIFDAAYSSDDDLCMINGDNGSKAPVIILCDAGGRSLQTIWNFEKDCYAYRYQVTYEDGIVTWINRKRTHDAYIAFFAAYKYDVKKNNIVKVSRAYNAFANEDGDFYTLAYTERFKLGNVVLQKSD